MNLINKIECLLEGKFVFYNPTNIKQEVHMLWYGHGPNIWPEYYYYVKLPKHPPTLRQNLGFSWTSKSFRKNYNWTLSQTSESNNPACHTWYLRKPSQDLAHLPTTRPSRLRPQLIVTRPSYLRTPPSQNDSSPNKAKKKGRPKKNPYRVSSPKELKQNENTAKSTETYR